MRLGVGQDQLLDKPIDQANLPPPVPTTESVALFEPPEETAIPDGQFGDMVRRGQQIFVDTQTHAAKFVGNELNCTNCHLDQGRKADSAPLCGRPIRCIPPIARRTIWCVPLKNVSRGVFAIA